MMTDSEILTALAQGYLDVPTAESQDIGTRLANLAKDLPGLRADADHWRSYTNAQRPPQGQGQLYRIHNHAGRTVGVWSRRPTDAQLQLMDADTPNGAPHGYDENI